MAAIYVLHENEPWTAPLWDALARLGLAAHGWHLDQGLLDLSEAPPRGVFYNRMSASSHTRGHRYAPELTAGVLAWLERHDRRVLNGSRALQLEISKIAQHEALARHGIRTPRTLAAVGREQILAAAGRFAGRRFITKHNRAGKGLGVRLFERTDQLARHLDSAAFEASVDGITLIQEYIEAPEPCITRVEFIGRQFLYAVRVDTSDGFELCPADACATDDEPAAGPAAPKFRIIEGFHDPLLAAYRGLLEANDIEVAAFEFVLDAHGVAYTYDINTNTNYNPEAERTAGVSGMAMLARFLGRELARVERRPAPTPGAADAAD